MITDLFGRTERFNLPGVAGSENWSQRLHATVAELYAEPILPTISGSSATAGGFRVRSSRTLGHEQYDLGRSEKAEAAFHMAPRRAKVAARLEPARRVSGQTLSGRRIAKGRKWGSLWPMKLRTDLLEHLTDEDIMEEVLANNHRYKAEPLLSKTALGVCRRLQPRSVRKRSRAVRPESRGLCSD